MRLNSIRERLVKARPQRGTAKAGRHAFSARSSFLTIRDLPKVTLETFSLASLLSLLFLIKGETGILGEYYSTHRALVELTGRELYWKWPEKTTAQPGLALTVN